jgi:hypothetical protein
MGTYRGTITITGKSEAIRLEKELFKSHPEVRQKSKVHAHVIGPVSVAGEPPAQTDADPVMAAFLRFLSADIFAVARRKIRLFTRKGGNSPDETRTGRAAHELAHQTAPPLMTGQSTD